MVNEFRKQIQRYYNQFLKALKRHWIKLKKLNYNHLLKFIGTGLVALPGVAAWLLEVVSMGAAISFVCLAGSLAYEDELWRAFILIVLSGMMVMLALLADHYTSPKNSKHGGGG